MIPAKADVRIEGNLTGQQIKMGIDTDSLVFLQSILTDLYSDPKLAVIREYSTNALDSHIEAGTNKPIEITKPNRLASFFKVKDYGIGLNVEDVENIYSKYAASTKRSTNSQTGMLGLGSKSALTYTNSFTMIIVKDGMKAHLVITRGEDNIGSINVVAHNATNDHNSVEIIIPVSSRDTVEFNEKIDNFFSYWDNDKVLIDGEKPEGLVGQWITPKILLRKGRNYYSVQHKLVMGGVNYNIDTQVFYNLASSNKFIRNGQEVIFFAEMGAVDFPPAREELHYTERTKNALKELVGNFNIEFAKLINSDIEGQPDHFNALRVYYEWSKKVNQMPTSSYRGEFIPESFDVNESYAIRGYYDNKHDSAKKRGRAVRVSYHSFISMNNVYLITDRTIDKDLTSHQKAKLRIFAKNKGEGDPIFLFIEPSKVSKWLDSCGVVKWQEILDTKIQRNANSAAKTTYYKLGPHENRIVVEAANVDKTRIILWAEPNEITGNLRYSNWEWADKNGADIFIVAKTKQNKFLEAFPKAEYYKVWAQNKVKAFLKSLTAEKKEALAILQSNEYKGMQRWNRKDILDPELKRVAEVCSRVYADLDTNTSLIRDLRDEWNKHYNIARSLPYVDGLDLMGAMKVEGLPNIMQKYPLIENVRNWYGDQASYMKHAVIYINAIYQNEQDNK